MFFKISFSHFALHAVILAIYDYIIHSKTSSQVAVPNQYNHLKTKTQYIVFVIVLHTRYSIVTNDVIILYKRMCPIKFKLYRITFSNNFSIRGKISVMTIIEL